MLSERSPPYPGSPTSADFALVGVDLANASRSTPIVEPSSIAGIGILRLLAPLVAQDDRRGERRGLAQDDTQRKRITRFVTGHGFSRAEKTLAPPPGFSPCSQRLKPLSWAAVHGTTGSRALLQICF